MIRHVKLPNSITNSYRWVDPHSINGDSFILLGRIAKITGTVKFKVYYKNNLPHREDGPTIEYGDGDKEYYLNGVKYSFEEWEIARKMLWML